MPIEEARAIDSQRRQELTAQLDTLLHEDLTSLTLEIGCGHGHFMTAYALAHPDELCLGIDIINDRLIRATRKVERAGLTHAHFLRAEAEMLLDLWPDSIRLSRIFILFPDPWPKRRHHKNRLLKPDFLETLARKTTPETRLYFRTDYKPYFDDAAAILESHRSWNLVNEVWPFEHQTVFQERADSYQSCIAAPVLSI